MLADELVVLDTDVPLWSTTRPLLDVVQWLEQNDDSHSWHGWTKMQLTRFLKRLPAHCALLLGVWTVQEDEVAHGDQREAASSESLTLGCICEVVKGEIRSIRTLEALSAANLPPVQQLEPGYQHAFALMQAVSEEIAPVAWALFTDQTTWNEWLLAEGNGDIIFDKGELLAALARQGRCVLMGSQTTHHHP